MHAHKSGLLFRFRRENGSTSSVGALLHERLPCTYFKLADQERSPQPSQRSGYSCENQRQCVGHIPDRLAVVLAPLLDSGRVATITGTITVHQDLHQTEYGSLVGALNYLTSTCYLV